MLIDDLKKKLSDAQNELKIAGPIHRKDVARQIMRLKRKIRYEQTHKPPQPKQETKNDAQPLY